MDSLNLSSPAAWPTEDCTRIPYKIFVDPAIYALEQERIFRGPTWSYVALEAEIPNAGDYTASAIGDVPIIVNRNEQGEVRAFVNRCAHRGAIVRRELRGNAQNHTCIYHQWCYNLDGELKGVPYHRGVRGQGGMPADFDFGKHGLQNVRVASYRGVVFATLSGATPPLDEYLDAPVLKLLDRVFARPVKVLGRNRQVIPANWKLYAENTRDAYHAGLLHLFYATFGGFNAPKGGGITLGGGGMHCAIWAVSELFTKETVARITRPKQAPAEDKHRERTFDAWLAGQEMQTAFQLADPGSILAGRQEFEDGIAVLILSVFPGLVVQQIQNTLAVRKIIMRSPTETELIWTHIGYADDDAEMDEIRLKQANIIGPAGFVSMEDGEVGRLIQTAVATKNDGHSVIELGGRASTGDSSSMVSEVSLRGFYAGYRRLMGFEGSGNA